MLTSSRWLLAGLPLWVLCGCYNTSSVKNGGLKCSSDSKCPEGFYCRTDDGTCWRNGTGACVGPLAPLACSTTEKTSNSECDPVCQNDCDCNHRCVLASDASRFVCETTDAPATFVPPLGVCAGADGNRCAPGSVCVGGESICPDLCYQTCRQNQDCPKASRCTKTIIYDLTNKPLEGVNLCSPPIETCNPTGAANCTNARSGFNCVFLAGLTGVATSGETVCDCASLHTEKVGTACTKVPDNCQPGAVCVDGTCRTVCSRSASPSPCPGASPCKAIYNSALYGYCS